ncbi:hypothetical protein BC939DRAFT_474497 [Gamsiella multidivaricata]|uniref:uncharacterized protein n=1 Tax=Gamsiella multidivaricata TaxID=101098 RepID=UPI00221EBE0B|nr:uncharacterized protein BC939DRAFT_474497 [Gamsiella multidivaricata]KAI7828977.1 hypothetical protein BC939DRAFT_474497 [Gamsiella multidivaricata]
MSSASTTVFDKTEVRDDIASKVNRRFSSQDKPLNLDGMQIKNKIENMKKLWKKANQLFSRTGNGARPDRLLKDKVLDICHFFYIMEVVWSTSWSMNPSAPCHLTSNLERHITRDASEDDSDENNGDEDINADEEDAGGNRQGERKITSGAQEVGY